MHNPSRPALLCGFLILAFLQSAFFDIKGTQPVPGTTNEIRRIAQASAIIQRDYYDPARIDAKKMLMDGFYELAKEVPEVLPKFTDDALVFQVAAQQIQIPLPVFSRLTDILPVTNQAFGLLRTAYKGEKKYEDMEYAFIAGMLGVLDPHSNILPPKIYQEFKTQTQGEYGGLGIVIGIKEEELTVISPIEGTPAFRAGIQSDDKIMQIGDQATTNMSLTDAVDMMRGKVGTQVTLRVKSKNTEPRDVTLTRELIAIESVQSKLTVVDGKKIGVIKLKGFQDDTYMDMVDALYKLGQESQGSMSGLVLDMRNNPGGLLDQAIKIADKFLQSGDIVYTVGANNMDQEIAIANKQDQDFLLPMIVLINEGSASASEIVAGALRNNNRALVMGTTSFGKGSVQTLFNLSDGSSLKLTVAQYLTPGKVSIQAVGISPDIHLYPSLITDEFYDLHEDEHYGEEKLDAHLSNQNLIRQTRPSFHTTYLKLEKPKEDESEYVTKIREDEDYPLKLATMALAVATSPDKSAMLGQITPLLEKEKKSEEDKIAQALKQKGINWESSGQAPKNISYTAQIDYTDLNGKPLTTLAADSEAQVKVKITNTTSTTITRVLATIDSQNPIINHKEFVIGKLGPNESVERTVKIKLPADAISFREQSALKIFSESDNKTGQSFSYTTDIKEAPPPQFAYAYSISDGGSQESSGNGNGIPEPGERIKLDIELRNVGPGVAKKTSINIKNKSGDFVFLKQARANLGTIPAGKISQGSLFFDIKNTYDKKEFEIDFFAFDEESKVVLSDTLSFNLADLKTVSPEKNVLNLAPSILLSPKSMQADNVYKLFATVSDKSQIKDIAIFVKGKKAYYTNLEDKPGATLQDVTIDLPLVDGLNFILIQARGKNDLLAQKSLSVVYKDPNATQTAQTN